MKIIVLNELICIFWYRFMIKMNTTTLLFLFYLIFMIINRPSLLCQLLISRYIGLKLHRNFISHMLFLNSY